MGRVPAQGEGWGGGRECCRACVGECACVLSRACAGLREWGAGARRELGLGRLPPPSSLPGTSAIARHHAGPGRTGKLERTEVCSRVPFPLQSHHLARGSLACASDIGFGARPGIGFLLRTRHPVTPEIRL